MKKLVFLLFSIILTARENPFVQVVQLNNPSPKADIKEFKNISFAFPDEARMLNKVKIYYTSIDGSVKSMVLNIDEKIDWHKVYMILDAQEFSNIASKKEEKHLSDREKIEEKLKKDNQESKKLEEKENSTQNSNEKTVDSYKPLEYYLGINTSVIVDRKKIIIKTYNTLIRQFSLKNPNRIVLDFKPHISSKNAIYNTNTSYVTQLNTGVHRDFYRIVFKLDGTYDYDLNHTNSEYEINLK